VGGGGRPIEWRRYRVRLGSRLGGNRAWNRNHAVEERRRHGSSHGPNLEDPHRDQRQRDHPRFDIQEHPEQCNTDDERGEEGRGYPGNVDYQPKIGLGGQAPFMRGTVPIESAEFAPDGTLDAADRE